MDQPLSGRVAIITGAGTGIGRSIARKMSELGATVIATDISLERATETVSLLGSEETTAHAAKKLDVINKAEIHQTFSEIYEQFGSIDILINNAGVSTMQTIELLTEEEWDLNLNVNAKGVFLCTQAVIPYMKLQNKGRIVNTASMAGTRSVPLLAHYVASKWAVIGFTKSAALELAAYGITVNCVCPGYVQTSMQERELVWEAKLRNLTVQEVQEEYIRHTPLGRLETPEDVAKVFGFLVSPEADFITGEAIHVTGGADLL